MFTPERFDALGLELSQRIKKVAPLASFHLNYGSYAYCCASWRLNGRTARELFVEQPGSAIAPAVLRVGIYFQDALLATAGTDSRVAAYDALALHRTRLDAVLIALVPVWLVWNTL